MDEKQIKQEVQKHYASIAQGSEAGCCSGTSGCCSTGASQVVELIDYGILNEGVVAEANLGLGCGLPTLYAGIRPGDTVLDLGSGAGVDVFLSAKAVGPLGRVIGVDMTPEMIARAWENAVKGGYQNVEFRLGEIEALPVDDESVDVVLSNCVINLVPDKRRAFEEIFRVLKPGGRFSISDIVTYGDVPERIRQDMALWAGCVAGALDRQGYLEIISEAGFSDVQINRFFEYDYLKGADYGIASITVEGRKNGSFDGGDLGGVRP
jgi:SAM-dependent methyltransferase